MSPPGETAAAVPRRPLYSEGIRERWRRPRFRGDLPDADAAAEEVNPLCGDRVRVMLRLAGGRITTARFVGDSCAICTASADVVAELAHAKYSEVFQPPAVAEEMSQSCQILTTIFCAAWGFGSHRTADAFTGRAGVEQVEAARSVENEKWIEFYRSRTALDQARLDLLHRTGSVMAMVR